MKHLVKGQWWTRAQGATDGDGSYRLRAFYGKHRIKLEVTRGKQVNHDVEWQRGSENEFNLIL
jgi:hypothetical protein